MFMLLSVEDSSGVGRGHVIGLCLLCILSSSMLLSSVHVYLGSRIIQGLCLWCLLSVSNFHVDVHRGRPVDERGVGHARGSIHCLMSMSRVYVYGVYYHCLVSMLSTENGQVTKAEWVTWVYTLSTVNVQGLCIRGLLSLSSVHVVHRGRPGDESGVSHVSLHNVYSVQGLYLCCLLLMSRVYVYGVYYQCLMPMLLSQGTAGCQRRSGWSAGSVPTVTVGTLPASCGIRFFRMPPVSTPPWRPRPPSVRIVTATSRFPVNSQSRLCSHAL